MMQIDPRVEQRGLWWSFHRHLIIEIFEQLRDALGDAYERNRWALRLGDEETAD